MPDGAVDVSDPLLAFYLFAENVSAWQLFMAVQSQWRGGMVREGLDYAGVQVVIAQRREWRTRRRMRFAEVRFMERVVLNAWAEQRAVADGARA